MIKTSLDAIAEDISRNRARDVQLTRASGNLADEVNRAVIGLQAHDIVSQKLAHAEEGLEETLGAVELCHTGAPHSLEKVAALARVEAAQMDAVVRELEHG